MIESDNNTMRLPKGWVQTSLGEIAEINPKLLCVLEDNTEVTFLPMKAVEELTGKFDASIFVPYMKLRKGYTAFINGDIIFAKITPCMENGKVAVVRNLKSGVGFGSTEFHVIRPFLAEFPRKYLFYYLVQESFRRDAKRDMTGSAGQLRVPAKYMRDASLPLPPLPEQGRIVARLEELFTRLDTGIEGLRKVRAQLKRYRQAVLKYAFEGKLTEEWRKTHKDQIEPAQALLQKIMEERIRRGIGQWKNADTIDAKRLPEIADGWIWVRAQEVCENITNGYTPPASELHNLKGEIPFIKVNNLTFTGKLDFSKNMTFIDKKLHETMLKRSKVLPGDVLINIVGPPLGKVSIVPNLYPEWNINQAIVFFRPIEGYNRDFLAVCLQTNTITSHLTDQARATAGQFNISVNMSRNLPIPLPPREEQDKIVSEVKKRFDVMERVEATINESMSKADYLRNSVLKAAFIGQLVPQDPSDEPAERLLERIRGERAKSKGEKGTRKTKTKLKQLELSSYVK